MSAIDEQLAKYKVDHDSFDPVQERTRLIETRLGLMASATQLRTHVVDLRVRVEKLKQLLATTPQMLIASDYTPSAGYNRGREQLMDLKARKAATAPTVLPARRSTRKS